MKKRRMTIGLVSAVGLGTLSMTGLTGCGKATGESAPVQVTSAAPAAPASGITPKKFADAVHAVMMADRTVYATHVVTRLKKQDAPVKPSEYWKDETHKIPLPAQMFRMGAELVNENPQAGFTYALKSKWPLNPQNMAEGVEVEGLEYVQAHPDETFYKDEELAGKKFFTAVYADKAVAAACWECHNAHANRGKEFPEFKAGDVMGGVVVRIPLD